MSELACLLGWLAPWWMTEQARRVAVGDEPWRSRPEHSRWLLTRPSIPSASGSCWLVAGQCAEFDFLEPALVIPLRWRLGTGHSPELPATLRELADEVLGEFNTSDRFSTTAPWGLGFPEGCEGVDLSELELEVASGKAALVGGLFLAHWDVHANVAVGISATWGEGRDHNRVGFLEAKLLEAQRFGCRVFFVPEGSANEAKRFRDQWGWNLEIAGLELGPLTGRIDRSALERVLGPYLEKLDLPPAAAVGAITPSEQRWYIRQARRNESVARRYYQKCFLKRIVAGYREQVLAELGRQADTVPTHLVSVLSNNWELIPLVAASHRVKRCLVFRDRKQFGGQQDLEAEIQGILGDLYDSEPIPEVIWADFDWNTGSQDWEDQWRKEGYEFLKGVPPGGALIDVTPGKKEMSFLLAFRVARPGDWLHYVRHEQEARVVVPGTEKSVYWKR